MGVQTNLWDARHLVFEDGMFVYMASIFFIVDGLATPHRQGVRRSDNP